MSFESSLGSETFTPTPFPEARLEGEMIVLELEGSPRHVPVRRLEPGFFSLELDGRVLRCAVSQDASGLWITVEGRLLRVRSASRNVAGNQGSLRAPMPGRVVRLTAREGETVEAGAELLRLEAMKMEHAVKAQKAGRVKAFLVKAGEQVEGGRLLVDFE
ncbi:MAG: biotin/lipoyl-containing protein [Planctomycetota bacterium]